MDGYEIWEVYLGKSEYIGLIFLRFMFLNIYLKEGTMKNIYNQNVAELAHYIIVFHMQELGSYFGDTGILV